MLLGQGGLRELGLQDEAPLGDHHVAAPDPGEDLGEALEAAVAAPMDATAAGEPKAAAAEELEKPTLSPDEPELATDVDAFFVT